MSIEKNYTNYDHSSGVYNSDLNNEKTVLHRKAFIELIDISNKETNLPKEANIQRIKENNFNTVDAEAIYLVETINKEMGLVQGTLAKIIDCDNLHNIQSKFITPNNFTKIEKYFREHLPDNPNLLQTDDIVGDKRYQLTDTLRAKIKNCIYALRTTFTSQQTAAFDNGLSNKQRFFKNMPFFPEVPIPTQSIDQASSTLIQNLEKNTNFEFNTIETKIDLEKSTNFEFNAKEDEIVQFVKFINKEMGLRTWDMLSKIIDCGAPNQKACKFITPDTFIKINQYFRQHLPGNPNLLQTADIVEGKHGYILTNTLRAKIKNCVYALKTTFASQQAAAFASELSNEHRLLENVPFFPKASSTLTQNLEKSTNFESNAIEDETVRFVKFINKEMGLHWDTLPKIMGCGASSQKRPKFITPNNFTKIDQYFRKHLPGNPNLLQTADISGNKRYILTDVLRAKIENCVYALKTTFASQQTAAIDYNSFTPNSEQIKPKKTNNKKRINPRPRQEESHLNQNTIVNSPSKKVKTTSSPLSADLLFEERKGPPGLDTNGQPAALQQTTFRDDDLFYNIPEDELFLPGAPAQQASFALPKIDDDLLFSFNAATDDDAFPLG